MDVKVIETAIIDRLKERIKDCSVGGFPDNPKLFQPTHPKGHILVHYASGRFANQTLGMVGADADLEFAVTIVTRNLRTKVSSYMILDNVRKALTGFAPVGCRIMCPASERFLHENAGWWYFGMVFTVSTVLVQGFDPAEPEPVLKKTTWEDAQGNTFDVPREL